MVLRVLEYAEVKEDDDEYVSPAGSAVPGNGV